MSEPTGPASFGRVADDGTVFVRDADGERMVGQIPDVPAEEALQFYVRRFESLEVEVALLEQRVRAGSLSPEEARRSVDTVRRSIVGANAVGDLDGLARRLDGLAPVLTAQSEARRAERAKQHEATREAKEAMVAEAESLSVGNDWRGGVNRFRALLEQWKALPRIDRATDDALWHRFSSARTTYTRRRKAQFAEQSAKRDGARATKDSIIAEARELADSTDWGPTSGAFRDLMARWKAAGPAPRDVDDALWAEFRSIQDRFFNARTAAMSEQDAEFRGNLEAKEALLTQAEATIVPVTDVERARADYREFIDRYNGLGKVPRDAIRALDNRVRAIESSVKKAEEDEWKRTDPEARQRAQETVNMLHAEIEKLSEKVAKAEARGDAKAVRSARDSIATYQTWLDQAQATLTDFTR